MNEDLKKKADLADIDNLKKYVDDSVKSDLQ